MRAIICTSVLMLAFAFLGGTAEAARVNIVHGLNGRDINAERSLPVDVSVDGECVLTDVKFTQSAFVELDPGEYEVEVHLSDGECSQDPVLSRSIEIPQHGGTSYSALVGLTQRGEPELFVSDNSVVFSPAAVRVRHFAKAGPVTVKFSSNQILRSITERLRNGRTATLSVLTNRLPYTVNISANRRLIARRTGVSRRYTIFNIVGSAENGLAIITESLVP